MRRFLPMFENRGPRGADAMTRQTLRSLAFDDSADIMMYDGRTQGNHWLTDRYGKKPTIAERLLMRTLKPLRRLASQIRRNLPGLEHISIWSEYPEATPPWMPEERLEGFYSYDRNGEVDAFFAYHIPPLERILAPRPNYSESLWTAPANMVARSPLPGLQRLLAKLLGAELHGLSRTWAADPESPANLLCPRRPDGIRCPGSEYDINLWPAILQKLRRTRRTPRKPYRPYISMYGMDWPR